jgi:hypothetical protein
MKEEEMRVLINEIVSTLSSYMLQRLETTLGARLAALEARATFIDIPRGNDRLQ